MADNEREITTVFRADISQFSAATQQLNRNVAQVNSEFKNATASMGKWNNNTDGLKAKLTQLNGVLDAEKKRLELMEAQYAELVRQGKENTAEAQNLATAINNQSAKVKECEKNIGHYTESLKELEDAGVKTKDELNELNAKLDDQKQAAKDLGGGIMTGAAAGVAGFAAACAGALGTLSSIVEETKELRTQMGQLETAFTHNGHSVEASKKTFDDLYAVLGDSQAATEASMHLSQFAKNEKELEEMTNSLTGAYARFGGSLPLENIAEGAATTLTLGKANAGMVDAIEFAGGSVEEFDEKLASLTSEEEKRAFILETLNGNYAKAGETYKEVNGEVMAANDAQNQYNQTMAALGEKAQPAMTTFKLAMASALQEVMSKFSEADIEGLIGGITNAITWLTTNALPPAMTAITWVLDNMNWLAPVLGGIVGTIGAISAGIKIYNGVMKIAKTVQLAWNLAMSANPIGLVVAAVGLLVGAFVLLWNKCEGFRNFFKGFVNFIIGGVNKVIGGLNKVKFDIPDWVPVIGGKEFGFNIKEIPLMAKGGIVDKPTLAMVGEAGKEAVIPLENNTQWIDKLADKLSTKGAGNVSYTINNTFERMETSRLALHQANLETKRILRGGY
jgi:phage-related protein